MEILAKRDFADTTFQRAHLPLDTVGQSRRTRAQLRAREPKPEFPFSRFVDWAPEPKSTIRDDPRNPDSEAPLKVKISVDFGDDRQVSSEQRRVLRRFYEVVDGFGRGHPNSLSISFGGPASTRKLAISHVLAFSTQPAHRVDPVRQDPRAGRSASSSPSKLPLEVPEMAQNVVWNTFLQHPREGAFLDQLHGCLRGVFAASPGLLGEYTRKNITQLVNLQVPLRRRLFDRLPGGCRLRVLCMVFAKFVNRRALISLCRSFWHRIQLNHAHKVKAFLTRCVLLRPDK